MRRRHLIPVIGLILAIEDELNLPDPFATYYAIYQTFCVLIAAASFIGLLFFIDYMV